MRSFAIACGLLLAACSTPAAASAQALAGPEPQARVVYGDLDLRDAADRSELVARVARAAADYCRDHADRVTPYQRRGDRAYCRASMRVQLMWEMPPRVRRAYDQAWRRRPARAALAD